MLQFEFNGHTSDEYGLIVTRIEENDTLVNRSLQLGEKNKYRPKENQFGTLYGDNYSFKMGVMRNPCRNKNVVPELKNGILRYDPTYTPYLDNGILKFSMNYTADIKNGIIITIINNNAAIKKLFFAILDALSPLSNIISNIPAKTKNNIRIINAWLTSPQYPRLLKFIGDDYFSEEIEFFATITEVSTEHASLPYELTYTVTCDSQWGYTPLILCKTTSSSTLPREYSIQNNSDCWEDYVYPTIKVSPKSHGIITIKNKTDNGRTMKINALKSDDFYIDCRNLKIYDITKSIVSFEDLGIEDIDDIYWPRLAYGENIFEFTGDATFEISYREPRKVGAFA